MHARNTLQEYIRNFVTCTSLESEIINVPSNATSSDSFEMYPESSRRISLNMRQKYVQNTHNRDSFEVYPGICRLILQTHVPKYVKTTKKIDSFDVYPGILSKFR